MEATATTWVSKPPPEAFLLFTTCTDQWWRRGRRFRPNTSDGRVELVPLPHPTQLIESDRETHEQFPAT